jgi:hypothetical protein
MAVITEKITKGTNRSFFHILWEINMRNAYRLRFIKSSFLLAPGSESFDDFLFETTALTLSIFLRLILVICC